MPKMPTRSAPYIIIAVVTLTAAVIVAVGLFLREAAPGNAGTGFLQGAAVAAVAVGLMTWRVHRKGARATTFERAFTQTGDERDDDLLTRAFGVMGLTSVPLIGVAAITILVGADVAMVLALLLLAQIAIGAVSFGYLSRRR